MYSYIEMLRYKRPAYSQTEREFCKRFLEPVFGKPDDCGNYFLKIGDSPNIAFMSHYDTVHKTSGMQEVWVADDKVMSNSNCLGADCTTGVYIMLNMIEAGIEGYYVVHAAEEIGCVGSRKLVASNPSWILNVDFAISFDRKGYTDIVTHQVGLRTCSDVFAYSLADILDMGLQPDDTGVYTDSNEYADVIPECTNLSVGYFRQHTTYEYQDLAYLETLIEQLIKADWSKLIKDRNPEDYTKEWSFGGGEEDDVYDFVREHPQFIADMLESYGITLQDLEDEYWQLNQSFGVM